MQHHQSPAAYEVLSVYEYKVSFCESELVYPKLQPYRQRSLAHIPNEKLVPRFYSSYKSVHFVGKVAYK